MTEATPETPSSDIAAMCPYWEMVEAILAGADAMRAAGEKYLPKFENESKADYERRRKTAPWTPIYEDISRSLASKPFSQEVSISDGAPADIKALVENIDGRGNHLHVFASRLFKGAIDRGIDWIFVDFPPMRPNATRAEEKAANAAPYWIHVPGSSVIAIYSDFEGSKEILTHVRLAEPTIERVDFGEVCKERVRVIDRPKMADGKYGPPVWTLYEEHEDERTEKKTWVVVGAGGYSIGIIPMVPVITGEREGWRVRPPLKSLAYMQVEEFQQGSNLKSIKEQTCYPMLAGNGVPGRDLEGKDIRVPVGPRAVLFAPPNNDGNHGEWKFIEPSSESIKVLIDDQKNHRTEMRDLGLQPLTTGNLTVVTTTNVSLKAHSQVQAWALMLKDALEQAFVLTALWLKQTASIEVSVFTDFAVDLEDGKELDVLVKMRGTKDISQRTLWHEMKRRAVLSEEFRPDDEELALAEEQQGLEPDVQIDPVTGLPIDQNTPPENLPA